jgi:hypothetical protein
MQKVSIGFASSIIFLKRCVAYFSAFLFKTRVLIKQVLAKFKQKKKPVDFVFTGFFIWNWFAVREGFEPSVEL